MSKFSIKKPYQLNSSGTFKNNKQVIVNKQITTKEGDKKIIQQVKTVQQHKGYTNTIPRARSTSGGMVMKSSVTGKEDLF
jgi:hypothetical protein